MMRVLLLVQVFFKLIQKCRHLISCMCVIVAIIRHEHPKETSILHQSQLQGVANQLAKANVSMSIPLIKY